MPDFNEEYFISLHKTIFETVYPFAGEYWNQDVSKGDTMFCKAAYIGKMMSKLFGEMGKENYLRSYSFDKVEKLAGRIAYYMGELIAIHPFWEFNGRIIRLFFDMIVSSYGYEYIDYSKYKNTDVESPFIQASIECVRNNDNTLFREIITQGLRKAK